MQTLTSWTRSGRRVGQSFYYLTANWMSKAAVPLFLYLLWHLSVLAGPSRDTGLLLHQPQQHDWYWFHLVCVLCVSSWQNVVLMQQSYHRGRICLSLERLCPTNRVATTEGAVTKLSRCEGEIKIKSHVLKTDEVCLTHGREHVVAACVWHHHTVSLSLYHLWI